MNCPRCKASMREERYEGVMIDRCSRCSGVWLDSGEIQKILNTHEEKFDSKVVAETLNAAKPGIPPAELKSNVFCPKCGKPLPPCNFDYRSGVIMNVSNDDHGIWLDAGELEKVQAHWEYWLAQTAARREELSATINAAGAELEEALRVERHEMRKHLGPISRVFDWLSEKTEKT